MPAGGECFQPGCSGVVCGGNQAAFGPRTPALLSTRTAHLASLLPLPLPPLQRLFVFLPGDYEAGQAYYFSAWAITSLGLKGPESQPPYSFATPARCSHNGWLLPSQRAMLCCRRWACCLPRMHGLPLAECCSVQRVSLRMSWV